MSDSESIESSESSESGESGQSSPVQSVQSVQSGPVKRGIWLFAPSGSQEHEIFSATDVHVKCSTSNVWTWYFGEKKLLVQDLSMKQLRTRASILRTWASGKPFVYKQTNGKRRWTQLELVVVHSKWSMDQVYQDPAELVRMKKYFEQQFIVRNIPRLIDELVELNERVDRLIEQF